MGYSKSWIAIRSDREAVRKQLRLEATGERTSYAEFPLSDASLPGGWHLITANACDFAERQPLGKLSAATELVLAYVEEHVMVSGSSCWRDGKLVWLIEHDSEQGREHLLAIGDLPACYEQIRDQLVKQQKEDSDVDCIFDIPIDVAKAVTGFRHDEDFPGAAETPFETLRKRPPWWAFWKKDQKG